MTGEQRKSHKIVPCSRAWDCRLVRYMYKKNML